MHRIVVIGGGTAGTTAAFYARRTRRDCEIIVVERERYPMYSRCGLPFAISGEVPAESLVEFPPDLYERTMKVKLLLNTEVVEVDPSSKKVVLSADGRMKELSFDKLILATGAEPIIPRFMRGCSQVYVLRTINDALAIRQKARSSKKAVIVGAGLIGLEVADALSKLGLEVIIFEMKDQVVPLGLDHDLASQVAEHLRSHGVALHLSSPVEAIEEHNGKLHVSSSTVSEEADFAVVAVGVRGVVSLAEKMGIELGPTGLIKVNSRMETSLPDIYAAGDCVESLGLITGKPRVFQLATTAARQGVVAGINAAGGNARYKGFVGSTVFKAFDLEVAYAGLTEQAAKDEGFSVKSSKVTVSFRARYMPHAPISVKLIAEEESHRVVGVQAVGAGASWQVDLAAISMMHGAKVEDLAYLETCYAPAVASIWSPLSAAAQALLRKLR